MPKSLTPTERSLFASELSGLINRYCLENSSNTPDFLIADYLIACLENYNNAIVKRNVWYKPNDAVDVALKDGYVINPLEPR